MAGSFLTSPKSASSEREGGEAGRPVALQSRSCRAHRLLRPLSLPSPLSCSSRSRRVRSGRWRARMRSEGGVAGQRTGNLETKFRAPPLAALLRRLAPQTYEPQTDCRPICQALACAMSGSSSVTAMKKVVQQLRLEAGLNRVKVSGGGRPRGRGRRRRRRRVVSCRSAGCVWRDSPSLGTTSLSGGDLGAASFRNLWRGSALWFGVGGAVSVPFRPRTSKAGWPLD